MKHVATSIVLLLGLTVTLLPGVAAHVLKK
jgi:hypothetical protein